jgi:hypothetical protein
MKWILKSSSISLIISLLLLFQCGEEEKKPQTEEGTSAGRVVEPERDLTFLSESGTPIKTIQVELADNDMERSQGLMDVNEMPQDHGMLFIFDGNELRSFWMANTPLSLDIMYVNSDSSIVRIYQNTIPFSDRSLPSEYPAQFVVETNGGFSVEHGITEGMKIRF